ncbi:MAG: NAD(+) synthase [Bacteroidaceae bacterium]|nr:NAD(+) synthase [Bacteroidaceae bacterium]
MNYGFVKVATAIPSLQVADVTYNERQIESLVVQAEGKGAEIICLPELSLCGYTCADLFGQQLLIDGCESALFQLLDITRSLRIIAIVGMPVQVGGLLFNTAVVVQGGKILGIVPKTYLPNYKEFYEKRWFAPATALTQQECHLCGQAVPIGSNLLFHSAGCCFGIELCEDLWAPVPPSTRHTLAGAEIIFNLSATNELICKHQYLTTLIAQQSARCLCGYVYASCGYGESTQDLVFAGNALIYENGTCLARSQRFSLGEQLIISEIDVERLDTERRTNTTFADAVPGAGLPSAPHVHIHAQPVTPAYDFQLTRWVNPHPFVPGGSELQERCQEIFAIQTSALAKRIQHTGAKTVVVGISGGLDSTLALLVCVKTMDLLKRPRTDIVGITMPGFGTTDRTYTNALTLMQTLGITIREISIREACLQHFRDIGHSPSVHDVTYENAQARERTQILMDVANQLNGFVVGTGDLSELALGWATYNADHMSNYGVNCSIPKTLVRYLVSWVAHTSIDPEAKDTLLDIIDTPISPELIPADKDGNIQQKTEDLVGPYELHDFFLYNFLRLGFSPKKIYYLAQQAFIHQDNSQLDATFADKGDTILRGMAVGSYDEQTILRWLKTFCRRFFTQQFKRSCLPDGPKVGSVSLSPRGDWRMPSDASYQMWLKELDGEM